MNTAILLILSLFLAYSNGANDNFKGVSTLFGSGTLSYRAALCLSTVATVLGALCSALLANTLVQNFSGRGLVDDAVANTAMFHIAIVSAVGGTVILATIAGFPISTTHAITGALVGAGFVAVGTEVNLSQLGRSFLVPLLASPLLAIALGMVGYGLALWSRFDGASASFSRSLHCVSGGAVCFARALNDTPKIVALMFVSTPISESSPAIVIACGMAVGGILNSRKVATTMSKRITSLNETEGLVANLVTSLLVVFSSYHGLPASTTHVAVGSMVGIGVATKKVRAGVVGQIFLSWILTLPVAAILSALLYWLLLQTAPNLNYASH